MSGPMDPTRLASLRANIEVGSLGPRFLAYVTELLEAHDHHVKRADKAEADARSWKSQADEEFRGQVAAWNEVGR